MKLFKTVSALSLAAAMVLSLSACSGGGVAPAQTSEEERSAAAEGSAPVGTSGVVSAYEGQWFSEYTLMTITAKGDSFHVDVVQDDAVTEKVQWSYDDVTYDEVADELNTMEAGVKTRTPYGAHQEELKSEEEFNDGAASFKRNNDGSLSWTDYKGNPDTSIMFQKVVPAPERFDGIWMSDDGMTINFTRVGDTVSAVVWNDASDWRWYYNTCVYDEASNCLVSLKHGVKTHVVEDSEGVKLATYEHEYTDGQGVFGINIDQNIVWVEEWNSEKESIVFKPLDDEAAAQQGIDGKLSVDLHASIQHPAASPKWVTSLDAARDENKKQLFVVAATSMDSTTATVSLHKRDASGRWMQMLSSPAYVGKNGCCLDKDHVEGCGQTPIGTYHFNAAFGIAEDPGAHFPYTKVNEDTYWSGDVREGMHYNEMVDINDYPDLDRTNSEHIMDYEYQYQYCLNISFNEEGTPGHGSAIFLHCLGPTKPWTGGCVAVPENTMQLIMKQVEPECVVVIDTIENLHAEL